MGELKKKIHPNSLKNIEGKQWKPGQSGNAKGRPPNIKYVSEALRDRLIKGELDDVTLADLLADALIKRAKRSDVALNILLDRTEGKLPLGLMGDTEITIKVIYEDDRSQAEKS